MTVRIPGFALVLAFGLVGQAWAGDYRPRTGDSWVDGQLVAISALAGDAREEFIDELVDTFGAPRYLVHELLDARHWAAGDAYYACALAYQLRRPCADLAREHEQDRSKGWDELARRLGIRPGSEQFRALKGTLGKFVSRLESHGALAPAEPEAPAKDRK